ncbi:helix-turn-helix domain-containing protein [Streptomyces siamensis]|uniref:HTH cro/C1-type domain-containing protein n=1 Tax=Streptomyces siamensis TaxID=1274986 RepID=A0ABP9JIQ9_9ACTN
MLSPTAFSKMNVAFSEVNVREPAPTMYAVHSGDRLKLLMERTGTGEAITSRELAAIAGVAHGTIGALMSGAQQSVPEHKAKSICAALGVDLLVLWVPLERAGRAFIPVQAAVS